MRKEFVAVGYDLKEMIRLVVSSDAYSQPRRSGWQKPKQKSVSNRNSPFVAGTTRRMIGEALFDSVAVAGNLTDYKVARGANEKTVMVRERVYLQDEKSPR